MRRADDEPDVRAEAPPVTPRFPYHGALDGLRALAVDPKQRYASAAGLAAEAGGSEGAATSSSEARARAICKSAGAR